MIYHSIQDLLNLAKEYQIPLWEVVCRADMEERQVTKEQSFETMHRMYEAMKQADSAYDKDLKSASGLAGGDGEKLHCYNAAGKNIAGEYIGLVMEKAVKMGESNACMKRIVAAPTAGACGVIPAVFLAYQEYFRAEEQKMVEAMYLTAGIGAVIAENAPEPPSPGRRAAVRQKSVRQAPWRRQGLPICRAATMNRLSMPWHSP